MYIYLMTFQQFSLLYITLRYSLLWSSIFENNKNMAEFDCVVNIAMLQ